MPSVNKVILIGHLGKPPELKFLPSGQPVANFSIATSEKWKDKNTGETKEQTEWHNIVIFGKLAEICGQYLNKGSAIYLEGRLQTRKWQDKNGVDRYTTEIVANEMKMLGGKQQGESNSAAPAAPPPATPSARRSAPPPATPSARRSAPQPAPAAAGGFDDDIPF